jgi:hypothetical protein
MFETKGVLQSLQTTRQVTDRANKTGGRGKQGFVFTVDVNFIQ